MLPGSIKSTTFMATNMSVNQFKAIFQATNLHLKFVPCESPRPNAAKIVSSFTNFYTDE